VSGGGFVGGQRQGNVWEKDVMQRSLVLLLLLALSGCGQSPTTAECRVIANSLFQNKEETVQISAKHGLCLAKVQGWDRSLISSGGKNGSWYEMIFDITDGNMNGFSSKWEEWQVDGQYYGTGIGGAKHCGGNDFGVHVGPVVKDEMEKAWGKFENTCVTPNGFP
jgi:hypothetical protein